MELAADHDTAGLRVSAAFALLLASAAGVLPPLLARGSAGVDGASASAAPPALRLKAFAGGVMLSLSVLHVIADSFERLGELSEYPWAGIAVLAGILFMFFVERATLDTLAALEAEARGGGKGTGGAKKSSGAGSEWEVSLAHGGARRPSPVRARGAGADGAGEDGGARGAGAGAAREDEEAGAQQPPAHAPHAHAHAHGHGLLLAHPAARKLAMAHLLEVSVLVHSLIIGADLGVSAAPRSEVAGFAAVLGVHQFFEGVSLGSVIADLGTSAPFQRKAALAAAFCCTTPVGVLLGVFVAARVGAGADGVGAGGPAQHALALAGALDGITGGMLLHMTLTTFIGEEFARPELAAPDRRQLRSEMYALLLLGVAFMAILAAWA
jgi:hypothetical protein